MPLRQPATLVAPILIGAARVALGGLWLNEGITKLHAGFGAADILLVADRATAEGRIPDYFAWFAGAVMQPLAPLFGVGIPLLETALGVLLILGLVTLPAALASLGTLLLYWSSDQLIDQYPVMAALSGLVICLPLAAGRFSATELLLRWRIGAPPPTPRVRRWI